MLVVGPCIGLTNGRKENNMSENETGKWENLKWGSIVGIIDAYGAVHSKECPLRADTPDTHESIFGKRGSFAWRWTFREGITWISFEHKPDVGELDAIQRHLTKHYGLRWLNNGHHDTEHFSEQLHKERVSIA